jgi:hypothetical protein
MTIDLAVAPGIDGRAVLHRADCIAVRHQAAAGEMVLTMLDCKKMPESTEIVRHTCLGGSDGTRSGSRRHQEDR